MSFRMQRKLTCAESFHVKRKRSSPSLPEVYKKLIPHPIMFPHKVQAWKARGGGGQARPPFFVFTGSLFAMQPATWAGRAVLCFPREHPTTCTPALETRSSNVTSIVPRSPPRQLMRPPGHGKKGQKAFSCTLEEERRLLTALGWQSCPHSDEDSLPLTVEEIQEFYEWAEQLRRDGFAKKPGSGPLSVQRNSFTGSSEDMETESDDGSETSDDETWD